MKIELNQEEVELMLDAINVWLDIVTPNDYLWAENSLKVYENDKKIIEKIKDRVCYQDFKMKEE